MAAHAINPPQWKEFAPGEYVDSANVKVQYEGTVAGYVRYGSQAATLYEVDCKGDTIRVHSDTQRYVRVPVQGGGTVVESDSGLRAVVPGSRNARIEMAICEVVSQADADKQKQDREATCQRALHDDAIRIFMISSEGNGGLTSEERVCLSDTPNAALYPECGKIGITKDTNVADFLHRKGIYLPCEGHPEPAKR